MSGLDPSPRHLMKDQVFGLDPGLVSRHAKAAFAMFWPAKEANSTVSFWVYVLGERS